jgi:hypothetical protein
MTAFQRGHGQSQEHPGEASSLTVGGTDMSTTTHTPHTSLVQGQTDNHDAAPHMQQGKEDVQVGAKDRERDQEGANTTHTADGGVGNGVANELLGTREDGGEDSSSCDEQANSEGAPSANGNQRERERDNVNDERKDDDRANGGSGNREDGEEERASESEQPNSTAATTLVATSSKTATAPPPTKRPQRKAKSSIQHIETGPVRDERRRAKRKRAEAEDSPRPIKRLREIYDSAKRHEDFDAFLAENYDSWSKPEVIEVGVIAMLFP